MFKENLKQYRKERNLSQRELALEINVSIPTIGHWESGYTEPGIMHIKKLAKYFGVTTDELLD